jgi:para-aminobenzoate synthetase component 1
MTPEVHAAGVRRILDWVAAGDCYQVNLTRAVHLRAAGDPWQAYRRLRKTGPAAFGAFLRLSATQAVLSNSPELLMSVRDGVVRSRPIKGTRARGGDVDADRANRDALWASPKDRAELTMIVDLVRNDLGRVAQVGSVRTTARQIAALPNVHHAWQEVSARLEASLDGWDALAAAFPPGSVTGAPKARACTRIAELENEPRGVYCGAIGFVDIRGRSMWNVAIRTAVFDSDNARYHLGGGIVAASVGRDEWLETVAKGTVLAEALLARADGLST